MALRFVRVLTFVVLGLVTVPAIPAQTATGDSPRTDSALSPTVDTEAGVEVELDHEPLLTVSAPVGSYSARERAAHIQQRLLEAAQDRRVSLDSIRVQEHESWSEIHAGDEILMWVTNADAKAAEKPRQQLAAENTTILREAVARYRVQHTWRNLVRSFAYGLAATLVLVLAWLGLSRLFRAIRTHLREWVEASREQLQSRSRWRVPAAYLGSPLMAVCGLLRWAFVLILLEIYVTVVLGLFPATQPLSHTITTWLFSQLDSLAGSAISYLPNLLLVIVIVLATYYLMRLNSLVFGEIRAGRLSVSGFYSDWADPTAKLVRVLILVLAAVVVFPYLPGSKSPAFQGISIFLGVLLSLGSSSAVANAVAGTILTYMRSFQPGDWVQIGTTTGEVVEKTLLVTRIRTAKNEIMTIPNGTVMSGSVMNYSAHASDPGVIFHTTVTIGYDAPWRTVHQLLVEAALATQSIRKSPVPFVRQVSLDDFYVSYEINAYTCEPHKMAATYSELHQNIQDKFNEAGVEIMSPHYSQLRDGNRTTIPASYPPSDYQPAAFRVRQVEDEPGRHSGGSS